jgi:hypothetical protein
MCVTVMRVTSSRAHEYRNGNVIIQIAEMKYLRSVYGRKVVPVLN